MSGLAETLDKWEESARKSPLAAPEFRIAGGVKKAYGDKRNVDVSEGYAKGKKKKLEESAEENARRNAPQIPEPISMPVADDELKRIQQRRRASRQRQQGRSGSILSDEPLG